MITEILLKITTETRVASIVISEPHMSIKQNIVFA